MTGLSALKSSLFLPAKLMASQFHLHLGESLKSYLYAKMAAAQYPELDWGATCASRNLTLSNCATLI